MRVAARAWVDVDVHQRRSFVAEFATQVRGEAGLLDGFAQRRLPRQFALVDVTARLQPQPETLVLVQQHSSVIVGEHDRGSSDVHLVGLLGEGPVERVEEALEGDDGRAFVGIDGAASEDGGTNRLAHRLAGIRHATTVGGRSVFGVARDRQNRYFRKLQNAPIVTSTGGGGNQRQDRNKTRREELTSWNPTHNSHHECCWPWPTRSCGELRPRHSGRAVTR